MVCACYWVGILCTRNRKCFSIVDSMDKKRLKEIKKELKSKGLTKFQVKVLSMLCTVNKGKTITYKELAAQAGYPNAYRAVGSVMRINPLAPEIPCHRVIKSDGSPGNYSGGGTKIKLELLVAEGAALKTPKKR